MAITPSKPRVCGGNFPRTVLYTSVQKLRFFCVKLTACHGVASITLSFSSALQKSVFKQKRKTKEVVPASRGAHLKKDVPMSTERLGGEGSAEVGNPREGPVLPTEGVRI